MGLNRSIICFLLVVGLGTKVALENSTPVPVEPRARILRIPVVAPADLDGKSREDILQLRRDAVKRLPDLRGMWSQQQTLETSPVWKDIVSGLPWLHIQDGEPSSQYSKHQIHDGDSIESFFINNPAVLVGLEGSDFGGPDGVNEFPRELLVCKEVVMVEHRRQIRVLYEVPLTSSLSNLISRGEATFFLNVINASDAGYIHYTFWPEYNSGFDFGEFPELQTGQFYGAAPIKDGAPLANQLRQKGKLARVRLTSLPATLRVGLWRHASMTDTDLEVIIRVETARISPQTKRGPTIR